MADKRILIADDDDQIRTALTDLFRDEGYTVRAVNDGQEALQSITSATFDILLTDLNMPRMDGHELVRTLHAKNINIPVVIIAASARTDRIPRGPNVRAFLQKPFDIETLLSTIDQVIN